MKLTKEKVMEAVEAYRKVFGLPKKFKWVAVDWYGTIALYTSKPENDNWCWYSDGKYTDIMYINRQISNCDKLCFKLEEVAQ